MQGLLMIVDGGRAHLYAEVIGDVEVGELGIDIGIDHREEVDTNEAEYAEVSLATIVILAVFEHTGKIVLVGLYIVAWGEEILVAGSTRVVIHYVEIGLRVVAIHLVVPIEGIGATEESTIHDGEFPIFVVVDLSTAREYERTPCCLARVGGEGCKTLLTKLATSGVCDCCRVSRYGKS